MDVRLERVTCSCACTTIFVALDALRDLGLELRAAASQSLWPYLYPYQICTIAPVVHTLSLRCSAASATPDVRSWNLFLIFGQPTSRSCLVAPGLSPSQTSKERVKKLESLGGSVSKMETTRSALQYACESSGSLRRRLYHCAQPGLA